jgi:hexosaminidase
MKTAYKLILFLFVSLLLSNKIQAQLQIIPYPTSARINQKVFTLPSKVIIKYGNKNFKKNADFLCQRLSELNYHPTIRFSNKISNGICLLLNKGQKGSEAYSLTVTNKHIIIKASTPTGIFYGIQSLLQEIQSGKIYCGVIEDSPRYSWRGFMLDESRHFFGMTKVKQLLDIMAYYKLNKFHWHLSDEPAWRIEIKKYPLLTSVGGKGTWDNPNSPVRFYTQEEIREIVKYASERHIEIIPEIDMPGHATAANRAYPQYSGGGTKEHPNFTFNVGKEETYSYLTDILREVASLFPSRYLHIGGDEVAYGSKAWETDPYVQDLMKRENLKSVKEAERYFMHRMSDSIQALGKTQIGWDELVDLNLNPQKTVIMWWRHDKPEYLKKSLSNGFHTILCPRKPLYYDFIQYKDHKWGRTWDGFCPLEDIYAFPDSLLKKEGLPESDVSHIIGMQANLWTELVQNTNRLDFMTFPRLCALAESAWSSPKVKNYQQFLNRMEDAFKFFDKLNLYYFDYRNPEHHKEPAPDKGYK